MCLFPFSFCLPQYFLSNHYYYRWQPRVGVYVLVLLLEGCLECYLTLHYYYFLSFCLHVT